MRVLVIDDDAPADIVRKQVLEQGLGAEVHREFTRSGGITFLRERYVDLVILDLEMDGLTLGGLDVLEAMHNTQASAAVLLFSKVDLAEDGEEVIKHLRELSATERPRVLGLIQKDATAVDIVVDEIAKQEARLKGQAVGVVGADVAAGLIRRRSARYPAAGLRGGLRVETSEVISEVDRLCGDVFGRTQRGSRDSRVDVRLRELPRQGFSAAVVLHARVAVGFGRGSSTRQDCVLKLGPRDDISEEVTRYQEFVRYGAPLTQRVELIAWSQRDALGAIVYSFAGQVHGDALISLDEALHSEDDSTVMSVLSDLLSSRSWYEVDAGTDSIARFFASPQMNLETRDVGRILKRNAQILAKLGRTGGVNLDVAETAQGTSIRLAGTSEIVLPDLRFFRLDALHDDYRWCLVHGDMHGGNVMIEAPKPIHGERELQVRLIDYRSAGPGPRYIDGAALAASVRIADALALEATYELEAESVRRALGRFQRERSVFRVIEKGGEAPREVWATRVVKIARELKVGWLPEQGRASGGAARKTLVEFLITELYYGVRQLKYELSSTVRLRLCAWIAAVYKELQTIIGVKGATPRSRPQLDGERGSSAGRGALAHDASVLGRRTDSKRTWFLSHAHEDKAGLASELARRLSELGVSVWYDEYSLRQGEDLLQAIDKGIASCGGGLVVLSPAFFSKAWTRKELEGLVHIETSRGAPLIPIWFQVRQEDVAKFSPILAQRKAFVVEDYDNIGTLARAVLERLDELDRGS